MSEIERVDWSSLRAMWARRRAAAAEVRRRMDPKGVTRPPRDPDEAAFLRERGLEGPFREVDSPEWRAWVRRRYGPRPDEAETEDAG